MSEGAPEKVATITLVPSVPLAADMYEDDKFLDQLKHAVEFSGRMFGKSEPATRQWKMQMLYIAKHYELDDSIIKSSM